MFNEVQIVEAYLLAGKYRKSLYHASSITHFYIAAGNRVRRHEWRHDLSVWFYLLSAFLFHIFCHFEGCLSFLSRYIVFTKQNTAICGSLAFFWKKKDLFPYANTYAFLFKFLLFFLFIRCQQNIILAILFLIILLNKKFNTNLRGEHWKSIGAKYSWNTYL